jgi:Gluconate 2-dehydrogenase subunit 3
MAHSFRDAGHLPKQRSGAEVDPAGLPRQRNGTTPQMHGRYPDFDVMADRGHWDPVTRELLEQRAAGPPPCRFFNEQEQRTLRALLDEILAQDAEPRVPVLEMIDAKLYAREFDGFRYAQLPDDDRTLQIVAARMDGLAELNDEQRHAQVKAFAAGELDWDGFDVKLAWKVVSRLAVSAFYSHPWAFNEIGFRGPAYPRGYMRRNMGPTGVDPDEPQEAFGLDPVQDIGS